MARTLLVLAAVVFFLLIIWGMRAGWRHRGARQSSLVALPTPPESLGPRRARAMTGLYVGTTYADRWQDRIVAHGLGPRAAMTAELAEAGVLIERDGADAIFLPADAITGAGLGQGIAGKVMGEGGLLLIRWRLGDALLDTGLRADEKEYYVEWIDALEQKAARR